MERIRKRGNFLTEEMLKELAQNERSLWRKYGIRVKVDTVSADRTKLVCSASRTRWSILRANMPAHQVVERAAAALACLRKEGVMVLVGTVNKEQKPRFQRMDVRTPFGIRVGDVTIADERTTVERQRYSERVQVPALIVAA